MERRFVFGEKETGFFQEIPWDEAKEKENGQPRKEECIQL